MDTELNTVREKIGNLSDALWRRALQPGVSFLKSIHEAPYHPRTDEEIAIWTDLTSPSNHASLIRYVEHWRTLGTNLSTDGFHRAIIEESARRWAHESGTAQ